MDTFIMKVLEKIIKTNWFWYLLLFLLGGLVYIFQEAEYSHILKVNFCDAYYLMCGVIFYLFIIQAIGISIYNLISKENNLLIKELDLTEITPFFIVLSFLFLSIFFFPQELKTKVLEAHLDKIYTISNEDGINIDKIQELSNIDEIFPDTDTYSSE